MKNIAKKILVVDDDKDTRWLLSEILQEQGYKILTSQDGRGAIRITKNEKFDLILLDLEMPGINGVETLKGVRKFNKNVPVIIISASENERLIEEVLKLGVFTYLPKVFDLKKLVAVVKQAMKHRGPSIPKCKRQE